MNPIMKRTFKSALSLLLLAGLGLTTTAEAQLRQAPSGVFKNVGGSPSTQHLRAGEGYMVAGDYWQTIKPMNTTAPNHNGSIFTTIAGGSGHLMMLGGYGDWSDPVGSWPSGFRYVNNFRSSPRVFFPIFKKDGWPGYVKGNAFRDVDVTDDEKGQGGSSRYAFATYSSGLAAASDPTRNYRREARFVDQTRRHMVYEAGWPTTAGIDFKIRAHQFTLNEQNLNDFVALEITLKNTGNVDMNADGVFELTDNRIDGIAFGMQATIATTIELNLAGDRGCNCINGTGHTFGYIGAPNPYDNGNPANVWAWFGNVLPTQTTNQTVPPAGRRSFGIDNGQQNMGYTDLWNTWNVIAIKKGGIQDGNLNSVTGASPDKETVFGTHPIGEGARKGWYTSSQWNSALASYTNSKMAFQNSISTWFEDYGKQTDGSGTPARTNPNPNFFSGGDGDDITTWTIKNPDARPDGDHKYASVDIGRSAIQQPVWEPIWNPGAANGSDFYGAIGYTNHYSFGQYLGHNAGPFSLEPGEEMTIVLVSAAGFRLEGLLRTLQSANWAFDKGWGNAAEAIPVPATPDIRVTSTTNGTARIEWTDVSSISPAGVDGYKVWKASQFKRTSFFDYGLRGTDNYHRQHEVGASVEPFLRDINPNYDAYEIFTTDIQGSYQPSEWGHYDLIAKIPSGQLGSYTEGASDGYSFAYEDTGSITGFTYWYYVSAYKEGQYTGPHGPLPVGHVETSNMNRNGRNGLGANPAEISLNSQWVGTYPWAVNSAYYPRDNELALKNLGASFTVVPPASHPSESNSLITVSPNPYKITGMNDVRNDPASHNLDFLNLPANYTLTIIDVSGQIIFQQKTTNAPNGKYTWDMFSKDGIEVASGLYIYVVEHDGGKFVGHFSILR